MAMKRNSTIMVILDRREDSTCRCECYKCYFPFVGCTPFISRVERGNFPPLSWLVDWKAKSYSSVQWNQLQVLRHRSSLNPLAHITDSSESPAMPESTYVVMTSPILQSPRSINAVGRVSGRINSLWSMINLIIEEVLWTQNSRQIIHAPPTCARNTRIRIRLYICMYIYVLTKSKFGVSSRVSRGCAGDATTCGKKSRSWFFSTTCKFISLDISSNDFCT